MRLRTVWLRAHHPACRLPPSIRRSRFLVNTVTLEFRRQSPQRLVHNPPVRPQWMILWDPRLAAHIAEERLALRVPPAHRTSPASRHAMRILPQYLGQRVDFFRILLEI